LGEAARAEALLVGAIERARGDGGLSSASWALFTILEQRIAARDVKAATAWLRDAAQLGEPARVRALGLELARNVEKTDPAAAVETYQLLLDQDASDREAWGPLLALHRRRGDTGAVRQLSEQLIRSLVEPDERNRVRMSLVEYLVDSDEL